MIDSNGAVENEVFSKVACTRVKKKKCIEYWDRLTSFAWSNRLDYLKLIFSTAGKLVDWSDLAFSSEVVGRKCQQSGWWMELWRQCRAKLVTKHGPLLTRRRQMYWNVWIVLRFKDLAVPQGPESNTIESDWLEESFIYK